MPRRKLPILMPLVLISQFVAASAQATDPVSYATAENLIGTWTADMSTFPGDHLPPDASMVMEFGADHSIRAVLAAGAERDEDLGTWSVANQGIDVVTLTVQRAGSSETDELVVRFQGLDRIEIADGGYSVVFLRGGDIVATPPAPTPIPATLPSGVTVAPELLHGQWEGTVALPDPSAPAPTNMTMFMEFRADGSVRYIIHLEDRLVNDDVGSWIAQMSGGTSLFVTEIGGAGSASTLTFSDENTFSVDDGGTSVVFRRVDPPRDLPPHDPATAPMLPE
jgi:hypothetical protein